MRKVLFLSPHLDDAVFSCATRILREVEAGAAVTVATVFSHAGPRSAHGPAYVARRKEDRHALHVLGAKHHWLGLLDAPWRNAFYNSFRRIVLETASSDEEYVAVVRERLDKLIRDFKPDAVYAPLAVGTHIDHRLVFDAVMSLPLTCRRIFYEDRPYALVRFATEMRLNDIDLRSVDQTPAYPLQKLRTSSLTRSQFIRSFRAAPYVRRYLPPGPERKYVEAVLLRQLSGAQVVSWENEIEASRAADRPVILRSVYAYRSQARTFLGSRTEFLVASRRHAATLGLFCDRSERYWKLQPPCAKSGKSVIPPSTVTEQPVI